MTVIDFPALATISALHRFNAKFTVNPVTGCWDWTAYCYPNGYSCFHIAGTKTQHGHRAAYLLLVGPIPHGLTVDHRCHNEDTTCRAGSDCPHRRCVNPAHMEPITQGENRARAMRSRLTCKHGHLWADTRRVRSDGTWACTACESRRWAQRNDRRRTA